VQTYRACTAAVAWRAVQFHNTLELQIMYSSMYCMHWNTAHPPGCHARLSWAAGQAHELHWG
jgi:hypothetical protein